MSRKRIALLTAAGVFAGAALAGGAVWLASRLRPETPPHSMRFSMVLPQPLSVQGVDRDIAISAAGTHIVYRAGSGQSVLVIRPIDQLEGQTLASTAGARLPFFSPDGRWVGFFVSTEMKKVSITGGPAISVCRVNGPPRGASWGDDDTITFATGDTTVGLQRVAAAGGEPTTFTTPDPKQGETDHQYPFVLPDHRGVLFTVTAPGQDNRRVAVFDTRTNQSKFVVQGGSDASYVASGHLVYAASGSLRAVPFDLDRLEPTGDPVPVIEQVSSTTLGAANYSVSRNGTLIYVPGGGSGDVTAQRTMVWVDRKGNEELVRGAPMRAYINPRVSPDGGRIAVDLRDQEQDIWVFDLAGQKLTRLTFDGGADIYPVWSRDSKRILFSSARAGVLNVFSRAADGTGIDERLTTTTLTQNPQSITPDGTRLIIFENDPKFGPGVAALRLSSASNMVSKAEPLVQTSFIEWGGEVSPDGRWLAYSSNEAGQFEVYVRPFPAVEGGRWQVSSGGGTKPVWSRSGSELFYLDNTNNVIAAPVQAKESTFAVGIPTKVVEGRYFGGAPPNRAYDVAPDGQRFLMLKERDGDAQSARPTTLTVVINWFEELKQRAGARQ